MTNEERKERIERIRNILKTVDPDCEGWTDSTVQFLLSELDRLDEALRKIVKSLDVFTFDGPGPVVNAYTIARALLARWEQK
jgi:hypothetical protein